MWERALTHTSGYSGDMPAPGRTKFLILGAGIAGLGAGIAAQRNGEDSLILEAADAPGGLCRSTEVLGCEFDFGPKIIIERGPDSCADLLGFLGDNYGTYPMAESAYLSEFGLVGFPLQRYLVDLPRAERDLIIDDLMHGRATPSPVRSYQDWLVNSYGRYFCEKILFPYEEKKWQRALSDMDYQWALRRPVSVDIDEVLEGAERRLPPQRVYHYPREGSIAALTGGLVEHAGPMVLNSAVTAIDPVQKYVVAGGRRYDYEHLISSLPLDKAIGMTSGIDGLADHDELLTWLSIRVFNLVFAGDHALDGTAIYFPGKEFVFRRVSVLENLCPALGRSGLTPISVEISLDSCGAQADQEDQYEQVLRELWTIPQFAGLGEPVDHRVLEVPHAYPVPRNGMQDFVAQVHDTYARFDIHHCGRGGRFDYCNIDVAFEQGKQAVAGVLAAERTRTAEGKVAR